MIRKMRLYLILLLLFLLSACGEYSPSKNDVVNSPGEIENLGMLEKFIEDVPLKKDSEVRVVNYTDEGDPIIHDLNYSNDKLTYKIDTREDEYGDQFVKEDECESIGKTEKDDKIIYRLEGCTGEEEVKYVLVINNED